MSGGDLDPLQRLIDVEEIKKLKARYFRFVDLRDWNRWGELFTEDAVIDIPELGHVYGRDEFVERVRSNNETAFAPSIHHGHMPEIEVTGPDVASGIWAMSDYLDRPRDGHRTITQGYGHYDEAYRKVDGSWKISRLRLTRLRIDRSFSEIPPS